MKTSRLPGFLGVCLCILGILLSAGCDILEEIFAEPTATARSKRVNPPANPTLTPRPKPVGYNAVLEITEFTCINGEEDDWNVSSGQDEITFIYTLIETDTAGNLVRSTTYAWGPYDIVRGNSYDTRYFNDLTLPQVPVGHGLMTLLSIVEIEDYSKAQKTMDKINEYAGYVEYLNQYNTEPYSKTAIEIIGVIIDIVDIGLDIVDWADDDDLLADQKDAGTGDQVYNTLLSGGYLQNTWVFSGTNGYVILGVDYTDYFEYRVGYKINLQPIYK